MSEWKRAAKTDLGIFRHPEEVSPLQTHVWPLTLIRRPAPTPNQPPREQTPQPTARLSHSGLLFSYAVPFSLGETRGHFRENSEVAGVPVWREIPLQEEMHRCLSASLTRPPPSRPTSSQARLDWWQPTGRTLRERAHKQEEVNGSSPGRCTTTEL